MEEIWKDVVGYEGYYKVSNLGNVLALDRVVEKKNGVKQSRSSKYMTHTDNDDGYPTVKLSKCGVEQRIAVHRLVAVAFVPNPNHLQEVNHKDFDRHNCNADNLEWIEHGDNVRYSIKAGRCYCCRNLTGEKNPNYGGTKLKEYYAAHPEEKTKLARKGAQNGRAKPVTMIDEDGLVRRFGYLRECANYLVENGLCVAKSIDAVADRIVKAIKNNTAYCNCHFSRA